MSTDESAVQQTETPREKESAENRLAVFAAILLGLAATLTALAAYQSSLADGKVLAGYQESATALTDSNYWYAAGNQTYAQDQALFVEYASKLNSDDGTSDYIYENLMRPELVAAVDWWVGEEEALTPFDESETNPYIIDEFAEGERLAEVSKKADAKAADAGEVGDTLQLATVLLALTLFFGGIATLFRRRLVSWAMLAIGVVTLVAGTVQLGIGVTS